MATIQIKHVPDTTHAVLSRRAAAAGQSLQQYLLGLLDEQASHPTTDELMDQVDATARSSISLSATRTMIEDDRAGR
ncbi:FitA-like ribbon-helix-helix domain-containing protein [Nocardioides sp. Iso805N]|uniref:FitA-like ribbon-helix-helix domain-containing protein n=1 Tax=Nocardioides sp. Iso805N TaxID=1283287 RepID=UPI0003693471|nr:hypothetical protein [Nocardioides sp. Iso805N]